MNLALKKQAFAGQLVAASASLLNLAQDIDDLTASYFAEGLNTGPDVFVDTDFETGANQQLSAAKVVACITALQAVQSALTSGAKDNLRKMLTSGIP